VYSGTSSDTSNKEHLSIADIWLCLIEYNTIKETSYVTKVPLIQRFNSSNLNKNTRHLTDRDNSINHRSVWVD
jgi:hypothetical protein